MIMRLDQIVYAPFYALFIVGPTAMLIEIWLDSRECQSCARYARDSRSAERSAGQSSLLRGQPD